MRWASALTALITVATVFGSAASAQTEDAGNAATWYERAYKLYKAAQLSDAQFSAIDDFAGDTSRGVPDNVRDLLHRLQPAIDTFRQGVQQPYYDPSSYHSGDTHQVFEHHAHMRRLAYLTYTDFLRHVAEGNSDAAMDRAMMLQRLPIQIANSSQPFTPYIGLALHARGDSMIETLLEHAMIGQARRSSCWMYTAPSIPMIRFTFVAHFRMIVSIPFPGCAITTAAKAGLRNFLLMANGSVLRNCSRMCRSLR